MNRRLTATLLASDLTEVIQLLQSKGILPPNLTKEMADTTKAIHSATYSLILWRFRLHSLPPHGRIFLDEIASDALQILPQIMMGFNKPFKLLLRGIAENTLRHIYFIDHPVEFERMNRDTKWYMSVDGLLEYAKHHPQLMRVELKFDALAKISSLYSDLSAGVHGRSVRDLEMHSALKRIKFEPVVAAAHLDTLKKCAAAVNFILAIFHHTRVHKFPVQERSLLLRTMPAAARAVWVSHDPNT